MWPVGATPTRAESCERCWGLRAAGAVMTADVETVGSRITAARLAAKVSKKEIHVRRTAAMAGGSWWGKRVDSLPLTQKELGIRYDLMRGAAPGITKPSLVSRWERGDVTPPLHTMHDLEVALGLDRGALLLPEKAWLKQEIFR